MSPKDGKDHCARTQLTRRCECQLARRRRLRIGSIRGHRESLRGAKGDNGELADWLARDRHPLGADVAGCSSRGNLAWDDADYLRRGLSNARLAESGGPLLVLPRAIDRLLSEQPKPPWFVAWIELGVHAIGRSSVDLLILFSTVVPYSFLMLAVVVTGRWLRGAWGGLLALVCLAASPLSLAFGDKVMVETFLALWVLLVYSLTAHFRQRSVAQDRCSTGPDRRSGPAHQVDDSDLPSRRL